MRAAAGRRERVREMLVDLRMPGTLEAADEVLALADSGTVTAGEAGGGTSSCLGRPGGQDPSGDQPGHSCRRERAAHHDRRSRRPRLGRRAAIAPLPSLGGQGGRENTGGMGELVLGGFGSWL